MYLLEDEVRWVDGIGIGLTALGNKEMWVDVMRRGLNRAVLP
jgi:hypothetical protein